MASLLESELARAEREADKGSLIVGVGADWKELVVGTDGYGLVTDSTVERGVKWAAPGVGTALEGVTAGVGLASKALVLDASGNVVMPAAGQFEFSNATPAAAGANAAAATVIAAQVNAVTGADGAKGVALPAAADNLAIYINNTSPTANLLVYPLSGGNDNINALAEDAAFTMGPGKAGWFTATSATQWYCPDSMGVTQTTTQQNNAVVGAAAGYMIARSAAPVALDGSNPTSVAHGLTTCVAVFVQLVGSVAPAASTSLLTAVINGANIDVYAWKPTGAALTELVASAGTETFNWFAIGV